MKITNSTDYIRQQEPGQFRRAGDGKKPFTRVNDQRVKNLKDRKESSVYIANKNIQTLEKGIGRSFPKLFDYNPGMKFDIEKTSKIIKDKEPHKKYDYIRKDEEVNKKENFVDKWV